MKLEHKTPKLRKKGGFTLIEIISVVAVLSILVTITVTAINSAKRDSQAAKLATTKSAIALAKTRLILDSTQNIADNSANFVALRPYLRVNGKTPINSGDLLAGTGMNYVNYQRNNTAATFTVGLP